jgi:Calcineurin-like phosphoesterase
MLATLGLATLLAFMLPCAALPAAPHDPDGRIRAITQLIKQQPTEAILYVRRGELHRQVGHLHSAFRDYEHAAKLKPDLHEVHLARGMAYIDSKKYEDALVEFNAFLKREPEHGYALLMKARTLRTVGRFIESATTFDAAMGLLPRLFPEYFLEQARAHAVLGSKGVERAITSLRRGVATVGPVVALTAYGTRLGVDLTGVKAMPHTDDTSATKAPDGTPPPTAYVGETTLVTKGSTWRYRDDGTNQGAAWRATNFNDTTWLSGPAQLGYGDGDESTTVSFGTNAAAKFVTTYFRHTFQLKSASQFKRARVRVVRDDGIVVYLNGTEIVRDNMPTGPIGYTTLATNPIRVTHESRFYSFEINKALLRKGANVLAVEIHQADVASPDISFDLELRGSDGIPVVDRGPYLQRGSHNTAVVRWRTDYPTETVAYLGSNFGDVKPIVQNNTLTTDHTAVITGLSADTNYHYAVGSKAGVLAAGLDFRFKTAPTPGTNKKTRIWVIGDSGTANANAAAVRDSYLKFAGSRPADVWLMLGDNAYPVGRDEEYQAAVFDMYPSILRNTFVWPTVGNHDAATSNSGAQAGPYYDIFTLPTAGEVGGTPSGTEAYYSFDHGDIHFISLNSADVLRSTSGAMALWLQADLLASTRKWNIVFWHHPPYSKGSHDSDNPFEIEMIQMRQNVLPILETAGVDIVLTGHSHSYERSFLLDGHYGLSSNLKAGMVLDRGDGGESSHGAYVKRTLRKGANEGVVYAVAGSSGQTVGGTLDHKAMVVSLNTLGSMVFDIDGDRLEGRFLSATGTVDDQFTIIKGVRRTLTRTEPTVSIGAGGTQNLQLEAGIGQAGRAYLLAGSLGTSPGVNVGTIHVPLNPDTWFRISLALTNTGIYQNSQGTLDFRGRAAVRINIPPLNLPSIIGTRMHHAYVVFQSGRVSMASNSTSLTIVK